MAGLILFFAATGLLVFGIVEVASQLFASAFSEAPMSAPHLCHSQDALTKVVRTLEEQQWMLRARFGAAACAP